MDYERPHTSSATSRVDAFPPLSRPATDDDVPSLHRAGGREIFMGAIFLLFGVLFLTIPSTPSRHSTMLLIALVNIGVGSYKLGRGLSAR